MSWASDRFKTSITPASALTGGLGIVRDDYRSVFGGSSSNGMSANDTFAQLTRDQWSNYVQNFVPIENKLIEYATDPSVVSTAMANASANVNSAFDNSAAATTRRLQGLGLTLDASEQKAATRSTGLARSLADVNAINTTRDSTVARQQSILGNPSPTIAS